MVLRCRPLFQERIRHARLRARAGRRRRFQHPRRLPGSDPLISNNWTAKGTYQVSRIQDRVVLFENTQDEPERFGTRLIPVRGDAAIPVADPASKVELQGTPSNRFLFSVQPGGTTTPPTTSPRRNTPASRRASTTRRG